MIDKILNLSNVHIDPREISPARSVTPWRVGPASLATGSLRCVSHEYGWIIFVAPDCPDVPEWLKAIHDRALKEEATLILFDRDGDAFDDFHQYDW